MWLYDMLVWPVLGCGAEIWGWEEETEIESLQETRIRNSDINNIPKFVNAQDLTEILILHFFNFKVMGGTSTINGMMYTRCNKYDYDNWEKMGNPGWSYEEVLPYFIKSLNRTRAGKIIEKVFNDLGYPTIDVDGKTQIGITYSQLTMDNGVRQSSNTAFIRLIWGTRPNLVVKNNIYVTRILIDPVTKRAFGVECKSSPTQPSQYFHAKKEVIVSAGAINSPRLVMVSGVGPAEELEKNGIEVIQNLPVGKNLQDHVSIDKIVGIRKNLTPDKNINECKENFENFKYNAETQRGIFSAVTPVFLAGFARTQYEKNTNVPDIYFVLNLNDVNSPQFFFLVGLLNPMSRGFINLNTTNPVWGSPLIYTRYFTADLDLERIIEGIRIVLRVFNPLIMKKYEFELDDTPIAPCNNLTFNSDEYWICAVRQFGDSLYHHVGTCKMGPKEDSEAVVNPRLRVYGINRLRVINASVILVVPRGNTNIPVITRVDQI
ncbi:glucose dehydrogenase [FAD, quinone]-like [Belonocnema kinseyi]|uniref:glucose dehydrogenase [FAD, quinone]-like n=1 Tax=Belonocnema kinseyi TaxID=2817044 RepID=UPI00143CC812|nr:glucose dehydrogenase [FAD, quinone]-like [Belonocnema kinseyi]